MNHHGIVSQLEPVYRTSDPAISGAQTLLLGGRWNYIAVGSDEAGAIVRRLDGVDTAALDGCSADQLEVIDVLV